VLRTNNGGEFNGKEFEKLYKQCSISHQNTTPYTPQNDGVVERMNMTVMDKARSMLSGAEIAQDFLAEVVDTAKYLVNMYPSSTLVESTPYGLCFGKKYSISYLRVFGYDAFVHVPKKKSNKEQAIL
jgi:hypothetical protein